MECNEGRLYTDNRELRPYYGANHNVIIDKFIGINYYVFLTDLSTIYAYLFTLTVTYVVLFILYSLDSFYISDLIHILLFIIKTFKSIVYKWSICTFVHLF